IAPPVVGAEAPSPGPRRKEEEPHPMSEEPVKVLCVDDNAAVAEAIELKLGLEPSLRWVGRLEAADGLLDEVATTGAQVVLLDIDMPGRDPFHALEELSQKFPDVRAIMLSGYIGDDLID